MLLDLLAQLFKLFLLFLENAEGVVVVMSALNGNHNLVQSEVTIILQKLLDFLRMLKVHALLVGVESLDLVLNHNVQSVKFVLIPRLELILFMETIVSNPSEQSYPHNQYAEGHKERHLLVDVDLGGLLPEEVCHCAGIILVDLG